MPSLILWGFRSSADADSPPVKLSYNTSKAECKRREKDGWVVAVYRYGESPDGLIAQWKQRVAKEVRP